MNTAPLQYNTFYHIYNRGINGCSIFKQAENYEHFLRLYDKYISTVANTYAWVLYQLSHKVSVIISFFKVYILLKKITRTWLCFIFLPHLNLKPLKLFNANLISQLVLMGNHFHLLVKIKSEEEIANILELQDFKNLEGLVRVNKQFSNLFNAYAKAFNRRFKRTGSLFEHPFHRIPVCNKSQLLYLIYYTDYYSKCAFSTFHFQRHFEYVSAFHQRSLIFKWYYIHHNPVHHGFCDDMIDYPWSSYLSILSPKQTKLKRNEVLKWYANNENFERYHAHASINQFNELQIDLPIII